jgi:hypothetical protein
MLYRILLQRPASVVDGLNVTMRILERRKTRLLKGSKMFQLKKKVSFLEKSPSYALYIGFNFVSLLVRNPGLTLITERFPIYSRSP